MAIDVLRKPEPADDSIAWARDVIARQLGQLTRLADDLLDVSRIARGKIDLVLNPVDMTTVVAQAVETSRPLIDSRKHRLTVSVPAGVRVRGDVGRLGQVLSNLLNNAAKYTPNGGRIALTVEHRDAQVLVTVADNGIGIPPEMLERVFDVFTQLESRDRARGGVGIGLMLVRRLIDLHGGEVEARSAGRGHGSEFVVRLPALEVAAEPVNVPDLGATHQPQVRRRILVVDDNVDTAEALSRVLRLQDQEVSMAHDGDAALRMVGAMQPDIVILDLELPKINGLEIARRLRTGQPLRPLLIAMTGFGQDEDRRRTAEAGFDHHLVKPIDPQVLRSLQASIE